MTDSFSDSTTSRVLGVQAVLERLRPDSEAGRELGATISPWFKGQHSEWLAEVEYRREAETWAANADTKTARDALSQMPQIGALIARLRGDEPFGEPELFTAKRFLWAAHKAFSVAGELLVAWGAERETPKMLADLLGAIHPEKSPSRRFKLSGELQPGLIDARAAARAARKVRTEVREAAARSVLAEVGGRFDIRGWYLPEDASFDGHPQLTLVDGRWTLGTPSLAAANDELEAAQNLVQSLETRLCKKLTDRLGLHIEFLDRVANELAQFDLRLAAVRLKVALEGCWPELGDRLELTGGRDPSLVARLGDETQAIDLSVGDGATVVTGPNMGGKSALLRLIGLVQWLAQHALPVPAEAASTTLFDRLVYVGSEQGGFDTREGLSSFGREVSRVVEWRDDRSGQALWLLDEFGRGTHPDDGAALASELVADLAGRGDLVVAATHFPAVANLPGSTHLRIRGLVGASKLKQALRGARDPDELRDALQRAMDYRPAVVDDLDVPRDARLVARALGLELGEQDE